MIKVKKTSLHTLLLFIQINMNIFKFFMENSCFSRKIIHIFVMPMDSNGKLNGKNHSPQTSEARIPGDGKGKFPGISSGGIDEEEKYIVMYYNLGLVKQGK